MMNDETHILSSLATDHASPVLSAGIQNGGYPLLGMGFITPGFAVAGLLLVSIPIIVHLLNRRRYKTIHWAAMNFLLQAMRKNRRRVQFEQWLLLATRCAVLGLLGLALARPLGCNGSAIANLAGSASAMHVIVLDNSYSMAYQADRPDAPTQFDQAKKMARQLVEHMASGGESVMLITCSKPAQAIIAKPSYDLASVSSAIDRVQQAYTGTDMLGALQLAEQASTNEQQQPVKILHILSDASFSAWHDGNEKAIADEGRKLATLFKVNHYSLAVSGQANAAVLDVSPTSNLVRTRFANDFRATARAFGMNVDSSILWKLGDETLPGGTPIKLDAQTPPVTQSNAQIKVGGPTVISVQLSADDRLKVDNIRYRTIDVANEMKVLIVEGKRGMGPLDGSGAFLELALAPPTAIVPGRTTTSYVKPERISDIELGSKILTDYRAIMIADVASVPPPLADQLKKFVEAGGTLVWFMGDQVSAESYNSVLLPRNLIPGNLVQRISGKMSTFAFNPTGNVHQLLQAFANIDKSGLDTAQVNTYWQIGLKEDSKVEHVLDFAKQAGNTTAADVAMTLHTLGDGRIVFFASSADAEWTSFPAKPAYVALMHEILSNTVAGAERWMNLEVGQILEVPGNLQMTTLPTLQDPTGANNQPLEQVRRNDGSTVYRSKIIDKPGVYKLSTGSLTVPISVNVPASEADIHPMNSDAIRSALGEIDMQTLGDSIPDKASAAEDEANDFGWSLMTIVLVLLGLECFMAMHFGHFKKTVQGKSVIQEATAR